MVLLVIVLTNRLSKCEQVFGVELSCFLNEMNFNDIFPLSKNISTTDHIGASDTPELYLISDFADARAESVAQYMTLTSGIRYIDRY
jgi:hypothetical protein